MASGQRQEIVSKVMVSNALLIFVSEEQDEIEQKTGVTLQYNRSALPASHRNRYKSRTTERAQGPNVPGKRGRKCHRKKTSGKGKSRSKKTKNTKEISKSSTENKNAVSMRGHPDGVEKETDVVNDVTVHEQEIPQSTTDHKTVVSVRGIQEAVSEAIDLINNVISKGKKKLHLESQQCLETQSEQEGKEGQLEKRICQEETPNDKRGKIKLESGVKRKTGHQLTSTYASENYYQVLDTECGSGEGESSDDSESASEIKQTSESSILPDTKPKHKKVHLDFTNQGGFFTLPDLDCYIHVLPNSICGNDSQDVTLIQQKSNGIQGKAVSHMYEFLPHKANFRQHILFKLPLQIPHETTVDCLQVLYSNTEGEEEDVWKELPLKSKDGTMSTAVCSFIWNNDLYLYMKHFCKVIVIEVDDGKEVRATPLTGLLFAEYDVSSRTVDMRVTFTCTEQHQRLVLQEKYGAIVDEQPILFFQSSKELKLSVEENKDVWNNRTKPQQAIQKPMLVSLCKLTTPPVARFIYQHIPEAPEALALTVLLEQEEIKSQPLMWKIPKKVMDAKETQTTDELLEDTRSLITTSKNKRNINTTSLIPVASPKLSMKTLRLKASTNPTIQQNQCTNQVNNQTTIINYHVTVPSQSANQAQSLGKREPSWLGDYDGDFEEFIKPVLRILDSDRQKLVNVAKSLAISNLNGYNAKFLFTSWFTKHKSEKQVGTDIWIKLWKALKNQAWPDAADELQVAIEKQRLKCEKELFKENIRDSQELSSKLSSNGVLLRDQYRHVRDMKYSEQRMEFIITDVILRPSCNKKLFVLFKEAIKEVQENLWALIDIGEA